MVCREPNVGDAGALARIHVAAWQVGYRGLMPDEFLDRLDATKSERRWTATILESAQSILVAEEQGELFGACTFGSSRDNDAPSTAEIYSLNVSPAAWGRGAGRALLAAATQHLARLEFSRVTLWVIDGNVRARTLYERFGFAEDGSARTTSDLIGVPLREVRYSLALTGRQAAG
jgi:RimJ/RimL family protein N-acetyltransferase